MRVRIGSTTFLAFFTCLLWSTAFVGVKYGLKYMEPFGFAGSRFMISGLLLIPFCRRLPAVWSQIRAQWRLIARVAFYQTFLLYALFYSGMNLIPGALGAIVIGSSPLFAALLAHYFLHEPMSLSKWGSIGIGMIGITLISISRQPWVAGGWREMIGILLLILGCVSSAMGNIAVSRDKKALDPLVLNGMQLFLGGFLLFMVSLAVEGLPATHLPILFIGAFLWLAVLSAVAFSMWFALLQRPGVRVSELNVWKFVIPVFGALLSWLLLPGEYPELLPVIGMVCVAASIVWIQRPWSNRKIPPVAV